MLNLNLAMALLKKKKRPCSSDHGYSKDRKTLWDYFAWFLSTLLKEGVLPRGYGKGWTQSALDRWDQQQFTCQYARGPGEEDTACRAEPQGGAVHDRESKREQVGAAGGRFRSARGRSAPWWPQEDITGLSEYLKLAENWSPLLREKCELFLTPTVRSSENELTGPLCFRCHSNT